MAEANKCQNQKVCGEVVPSRKPAQMKLLTTKSVADILSVPEGTIRYWRKIGTGPAWVKLEGSIRYAESDVLRYIERNRRTPSVRAYGEENNAI